MPRSAKSFGAIRVATPAAPRGRRVGLMGGSFNPPHEGHLEAAEAALARLALDELWWVVTPGNPLKSHGALAPLADRLAAVGDLARHPRMVATGLEEALGSPYTSVTLAFLRTRYPTVRFVWIMGADNLAHFHRWHDWRGIAARMPIVVVDRPGWRFKALASPAGRSLAAARWPEARAARLAAAKPPAWVFLGTRLSPRSSTAMRLQRSES